MTSWIFKLWGVYTLQLASFLFDYVQLYIILHLQPLHWHQLMQIPVMEFVAFSHPPKHPLFFISYIFTMGQDIDEVLT